MDNVKEDFILDAQNSFEKYKNKRWLLLILAVLMMICISICYGWSILSAPISKDIPNWNETFGGLVFTIFMYSYGIFGVLGSILAHKIGNSRLNLALSAVFMVVGFLITSFADNFVLLILGFSILSGAGTALTYNAVVVTITKWFSDKLGVATGCILMGYGMGPFIIGSFYTYLIENGFIWQNVFQILGVFIGVVLLLGAVFLMAPPEDYIPPIHKPKVDKFPVETKEMPPLQMIKRVSFWILFLMGCTATMPSMVYSGFGRQLVENVALGIDANTIAFIVGGISVANGCGRIFTGFLNDKFGLGVNIRISAFGVSLGVVFILFATLANSLVFMTIALLFAGFTAGMSAPDGALITRKLYGEKYYQMNLQVLLLAGFVNSLGVTIFGNIYEISGGFILPLLILAGISLIGFICASLIKKP